MKKNLFFIGVFVVLFISAFCTLSCQSTSAEVDSIDTTEVDTILTDTIDSVAVDSICFE